MAFRVADSRRQVELPVVVAVAVEVDDQSWLEEHRCMLVVRSYILGLQLAEDIRSAVVDNHGMVVLVVHILEKCGG